MSALPRCGDTVSYLPLGQEWIVAYCGGGFLAPAGWPDSLAKLEDCALVKACSEAEHRNAVELWRRSIPSSRRTRVLELYGP